MASKFGQFLNYYTNQIGAADSAAYQREQTRALQRGNNEADMADTISTLINQGIFDEKGNLTPGGLEKLHDANIGEQYVDFMNIATVANNFRNKFGDVEKGTILGPTETEAGTFIFNVRKRDGKLAPLTERRSQDPDDKSLQFSKEDLKNFYEAQARNLLQKGGLVGQAIGTTAEQSLTRAIGDTSGNLAPESFTEIAGQVNSVLNKNRSPEEKAAIDSEPSGRDVEFGPSVVAQRQKDKESQFFRDDSVTPTEDTFTFSYLTEAEENALPPVDKALYKKLKEAHEINIGNLSTSKAPKAIQNQINRIEQKITALKEKSSTKISREEEKRRGPLENRKKVIQQNLQNNPALTEQDKTRLENELSRINTSLGSKDTTSQIETIPALPDNIQDARQWFTDNQSTLEKLPEEDYTKIQNLLKEQNISSANDLGQAVRQGKISQVDGLKAAALIAFAVNGPSGSITDKLNVYNSLTNTFLRGDPQLTPAAVSGIQRDIAAIQSSYASLATAAQSEFFDPIRKSADELRSSFTDDNDQYIKKLTPKTKIAMRKFFSDFLTNAPRLALSDQPRAVAEAKQIIGQALFILGSDSGNLKDWFGDIIARDTVDPAVGLFDNLRVRRNNKGQAVEIVFVNSVNPQEETEYSVFPPELINQFGKMVELLDNQSGALGIPDLNPRAVEKKKG